MQNVGVNVEVKMATSGALSETPKHEVDRVVEPIVRVLEECAGHRQLYVSSFDPDIMKAVARHRQAGALTALPNLTLWYLSTGGTDLHADERRMSIAAAVAFAQEAGIDGIVAETEAARDQRGALNAALAARLKVWHCTAPPLQGGFVPGCLCVCHVSGDLATQIYVHCRCISVAVLWVASPGFVLCR